MTLGRTHFISPIKYRLDSPDFQLITVWRIVKCTPRITKSTRCSTSLWLEKSEDLTAAETRTRGVFVQRTLADTRTLAHARSYTLVPRTLPSIYTRGTLCVPRFIQSFESFFHSRPDTLRSTALVDRHACARAKRTENQRTSTCTIDWKWFRWKFSSPTVDCRGYF